MEEADEALWFALEFHMVTVFTSKHEARSVEQTEGAALCLDVSGKSIDGLVFGFDGGLYAAWDLRAIINRGTTAITATIIATTWAASATAFATLLGAITKRTWGTGAATASATSITAEASSASAAFAVIAAILGVFGAWFIFAKACHPGRHQLQVRQVEGRWGGGFCFFTHAVHFPERDGEYAQVTRQCERESKGKSINSASRLPLKGQKHRNRG